MAKWINFKRHQVIRIINITQKSPFIYLFIYSSKTDKVIATRGNMNVALGSRFYMLHNMIHKNHYA